MYLKHILKKFDVKIVDLYLWERLFENCGKWKCDNIVL